MDSLQQRPCSRREDRTESCDTAERLEKHPCRPCARCRIATNGASVPTRWETTRAWGCAWLARKSNAAVRSLFNLGDHALDGAATMRRCREPEGASPCQSGCTSTSSPGSFKGERCVGSTYVYADLPVSAKWKKVSTTREINLTRASHIFWVGLIVKGVSQKETLSGLFSPSALVKCF